MIITVICGVWRKILRWVMRSFLPPLWVREKKCDNSKQTVCKKKIQETKWLEWDKKYMKTILMPLSHNTKVPRSSVIKLPPECVIMEAVIQRCSLKWVFLKSRKIFEKYPGRDFLLKLYIITCNLKLNFFLGILPGFC